MTDILFHSNGESSDKGKEAVSKPDSLEKTLISSTQEEISSRGSRFHLKKPSVCSSELICLFPGT
ncbi:MAG: hypothetical protein DRI99_01430 [Candidatus Aminicenantes bacterium]|nr:MAG: hypothetical protein DRJ11_03955 [Candidatus Aminicenantes bacterium]RLE05755.1 MAG: hypothetical protein DRI99_01430 [Candidatus Aminicenantes bacterium]